MKTKQRNFRAKLPYYLALSAFDGTAIIHEALDNSPNQPFRRELAKQKEAYDRREQQEESRRAEEIHPASQEFRD